MHDLIAPVPRPLRLAPSFTHHAHTSPAASLIRPNPAVRLVSAPPTDSFARITLADGDEEDSHDRDRPSSAYDDSDRVIQQRDPASPRMSPDALEEFLSILHWNTPASPVLRTRYERPHPYKSKAHRRTRSTSSATSDGCPRTPERMGASKSSNSEERDEVGDEIVFDPRPWPYSSFLSSPISRTHTQNPLARHVTHDFEAPFQNTYLLRAPPSPISSPATIALAQAQSVPIPATPPSQISSPAPSPHAMEI